MATQPAPGLLSRDVADASEIASGTAAARDPPVSATHSVTAWSGFAALAAMITVLAWWQPLHNIAYLALLLMMANALGAVLPEVLWRKSQQRSLATSAERGDWSRVRTKCVGLAASAGCVALCYWAFPEYHRGQNFYGNYWTALQVVLPVWALLTVPYIYWVDSRMAQPRDGLWHTGQLFLGRWDDLAWSLIGQHLLGWVVKGFFLPLMFTYMCNDLNRFLHYDRAALLTFRGFYDWAYFMLYFIDVSLVSMTYTFALRAADTHIRSVEPTVTGWLVALLCYEPFWSLIGKQYLSYDNGPAWGDHLAGIPWAYMFWGCLILSLVAIYLWATIAFGARFSNLTHRGIITNGPYRYTKHPAYIAKNLSWWLISMPFTLSGSSVPETLRRCLALLLLNGVYYLRAKTEERHLALDPVYRQYAAWIERHGLLRWLDRIPGVRTLARWRPASFSASPSNW